MLNHYQPVGLTLAEKLVLLCGWPIYLPLLIVLLLVYPVFNVLDRIFNHE